ncbi:MAG TPA: hypothetical protein VKN18_03350 [Blastocatellia bacterium]|nr:hypothetical protein [Blastocatellia bacterium]
MGTREMDQMKVQAITSNANQSTWFKPKQLYSSIRRMRLRTKILICIWALFFVLVGFGIHGSSTAITAEWWAPERPYSGYLLGGPAEASDETARMHTPTFKEEAIQNPIHDNDNPRSLLMRNAREIRWDELVIATPWALSQLSHRPRFPVINKNIGNGQNMLVTPHAPVLHIATLARPATWGYFFLGAQRGLAWYWWFQPFACFTVLWLLFEIALAGNSPIAAFGAFWYCNSAYVICWSLWPSHVTFFAALACLAAYHLLHSEKQSVRLTSSVLLGLSIPGFIMFLYPPWQVPVAYFVIILFVALVVREKFYVSISTRLKQRRLYILVAMLIGAALTLSWLITCLPDLRAMSDAVYPGRRISLGGDYTPTLLLKGTYNFETIYRAPVALLNQSEASSFYYLFPAALIALVFARDLRIRLGVVGWAMVYYLIIALIFLFVGFPPILSKITLLSYVPGYRGDLGIGLASILLTIRVLIISTQQQREGAVSRWKNIWPIAVAVAVALLLLGHAYDLMKETEGFPSRRLGVLTALVGGVVSYLLLAGLKKSFCAIVGVIVLGTSALFNPLSTDLSHLYDSELSREIIRLNKESSAPPLWVCFGGAHTGALITILGGRSMSGIQWPPQLSMWRTLDPARLYEKFYNQYAEVSLDYLQDATRVSFSSPHDGELRVFISPDNVGLKTLGARYMLLADEAVDGIPTDGFRFVFKSNNGRYSIFEFPTAGESVGP